MIKKTLALACLSFTLAVPAFCQTSETTSVTDTTTAIDTPSIKTFKPHGGNATIEAGINFFEENDIYLNQIRGRIFLSSEAAFRLGVNASFNNSKQSPTSNVERNYNTFGIATGIEKHFTGTDRLSPYIGVELTWNKASSKDETQGYTIENGWYGNSNRAYKSFGANVIFGADFYVAKNFYIGIEAGIGYARYDYEDIVSREYDPQQTPSLVINTSKGFKSNSFGTQLKNGIRIGYAF